MSDVISVNKKVSEFLCGRWETSVGAEENSWIV